MIDFKYLFFCGLIVMGGQGVSLKGAWGIKAIIWQEVSEYLENVHVDYARVKIFVKVSNKSK
jgi:hypothetical protein